MAQVQFLIISLVLGCIFSVVQSDSTNFDVQKNETSNEQTPFHNFQPDLKDDCGNTSHTPDCCKGNSFSKSFYRSTKKVYKWVCTSWESNKEQSAYIIISLAVVGALLFLFSFICCCICSVGNQPNGRHSQAKGNNPNCSFGCLTPFTGRRFNHKRSQWNNLPSASSTLSIDESTLSYIYEKRGPWPQPMTTAL